MHTLSASELLQAWEAALAQSPLERPLALLAAGFPDQSYSDLSQQPIGRRNEQLIALRRYLLGGAVTALADCPRCGERVMLDFTLDDVRAEAMPIGIPELAIEDFAVTCHAPGTRDLLAAAKAPPADMRLALLRSCIDAARRGGSAVPAESLPAGVLESVAESLARCDPQADMQLSLRCPACEHAWEAAFDIAGFLWAEITAWARTMLNDIHTIASAYGWSESDILTLPPGRRWYYLEMIGA